MSRYCLIGPTYPFRGGIAHYTTLLAQHLKSEHEVLLISFTRQYPKWLFPGRSDRDPSQRPLTTEVEYILDPINPFSWRRALRRVSEWGPDMVIIPWWVPFWAPAWAMLGWRIKHLTHHPKLVYICHNVFPHERGRIDRPAARVALSPGDGYIVHSQSDADLLQELFPKAHIKTVHLPTYRELVSVEKGLLPSSIPSDAPLLLFCGFVRPYKGLDILIKAMPMVLVKQRVHLLIAGEFWDQGPDYRKLIDDLDLSQEVTIIDQYLPNELLAACLDIADVVVLPYRSATQSAVIQLAFGLDTPVITTDVGGLAEVVRHGRTGLVVPPEDPQALARAINQFFEDGLGPTFAANLENEKDRFAWDNLVEVLGDLLQ